MEVMQKRASALTRDEKRRFLRKVAERPDFVDVAQWMNVIGWNEFDVLMLFTVRPLLQLQKNLLSNLTGDLGKVLERLDSWMYSGPLDILPLLRQSPFITPEAEALLIRKVRGDVFRMAIGVICAEHRLPLPRAFSFEGLAAKTGRLLRVILERGMSEMAFRRWMQGMVGVRPEAEELVRVKLSLVLYSFMLGHRPGRW